MRSPKFVADYFAALDRIRVERTIEELEAARRDSNLGGLDSPFTPQWQDEYQRMRETAGRWYYTDEAGRVFWGGALCLALAVLLIVLTLTGY